MAASPYMQFYCADHLADTAHLSTLEQGAYMLLIMTYWQRGKPLLNSNERLANVVRMLPDEWLKIEPALSEFFEVNETCWTHKRIESELAKFRDKSELARNAGRASAQRRGNTRSTGAQRTFNGRSTHAQQTLNHTDTDTDSESVVSEDKSSSPPRANPKGAYTQEFEAFWKAYPPNAGSKKGAEKSYMKSIKEGHSHEQIITGAAAYARYIEREGTLIAHASTWLNGQRWETQYDNLSAKQVTRSTLAGAATSIGTSVAHQDRDSRDPATRARDIGESIIAKRNSQYAAAEATALVRTSDGGKQGGREPINHPAISDLRGTEGIR